MVFEEREIPRRRRRPLLTVIVVLVILAIIAVVLVVADGMVRSYAGDRVRTELRTALALPDDADLDVRIGGFSMLLQLVSGSLDRVDVETDEVAFGELTGPARLTALGVPIDQSRPVDDLRLRFGASEQSLTSISQNLSGLPITSVTIDGDAIDIAAELDVFLAKIPLGVGLKPSAVDGQIVFAPTSIRVADAEFGADDLRDRFGAVADTALATQNLCIAQYVPAPLILQHVTLDDPLMVLSFEARDVVLDTATLGAVGTC